MSSILPPNVKYQTSVKNGIVSDKILMISCEGVNPEDLSFFVLECLKKIKNYFGMTEEIEMERALIVDPITKIPVHSIIYFKDQKILKAFFNHRTDDDFFYKYETNTYFDPDEIPDNYDTFRAITYGCGPSCDFDCKGKCNGSRLRINWGDIAMPRNEEVKVPIEYILKDINFDYVPTEEALKISREKIARERDPEKVRILKSYFGEIRKFSLRIFSHKIVQWKRNNVLDLSLEGGRPIPKWITASYLHNKYLFYMDKVIVGKDKMQYPYVTQQYNEKGETVRFFVEFPSAHEMECRNAQAITENKKFVNPKNPNEKVLLDVRFAYDERTSRPDGGKNWENKGYKKY